MSEGMEVLAKCRVCGRTLKDPISIKIGVGPVCLGKKRVAVKRINNKIDEENAGILPPQFHGFVMPEDLKKVNPAKVYTAIRGEDENDENTITVFDEKGTRPLKHIVYHSPTGMEWGCGGSGPLDLARSILADFAGIKVADMFYQEFKRDFIAKQPEKGFQISGQEILDWLKRKIQHD
jgi:hypothetical protein